MRCPALLLAALALAASSCATPAPGTPLAGAPPEPVLACTDFDAFANGAWRAANPRPPGRPRWSRRARSREANRRQVQALLEEVSRRTDWPTGSAEQVAGDAYAACLDEAAIEATGRAPLEPWLAELAAVRTAADVQRQLRRLHQVGIPALFGAAGAMDYQAPTRLVANLTAGGLGLGDRDAYLDGAPGAAEQRQRYQARVEDGLRTAGLPEAQARVGAEAILALERRLAEARLPAALAGDPARTAHRTTFAELQRLASHLDWLAYFEEAGWPRSDLNLAEPDFLRALDGELARTPVPVWRAYLTWQLLDAAAPALSSAFARLGSSPGGPAPRAERCAESTEALFGEAVGRLYAARHFPPAARARGQALMQALVEAMRGEVERFGWMSEPTRQKALAKLATFNPQLGYPDTWQDLSTVKVDRRSAFANLLAGRRLKVEADRRLVGHPTPPGWWQLPASSPDAYLEPQLNQLVVPAGFLQPPAFDPGAPDAVNFGAIGVGLAHDLFHAIDPLGADFDPSGRPAGWWTAEDRSAFEARARCVQEQFEAFPVAPGLRHRGPLVSGEAVADLVGTRVAYRAWQQVGRRSAPAAEGRRSEDQAFFVSLAQLRGEELSPEALGAQLERDIHPVGRYRILGTLQNLPEFQEAFGCQAGDAMVRRERCSLW